MAIAETKREMKHPCKFRRTVTGRRNLSANASIQILQQWPVIIRVLRKDKNIERALRTRQKMNLQQQLNCVRILIRYQIHWCPRGSSGSKGRRAADQHRRTVMTTTTTRNEFNFSRFCRLSPCGCVCGTPWCASCCPVSRRKEVYCGLNFRN